MLSYEITIKRVLFFLLCVVIFAVCFLFGSGRVSTVSIGLFFVGAVEACFVDHVVGTLEPKSLNSIHIIFGILLMTFSAILISGIFTH